MNLVSFPCFSFASFPVKLLNQCYSACDDSIFIVWSSSLCHFCQGCLAPGFRRSHQLSVCSASSLGERIYQMSHMSKLLAQYHQQIKCQVIWMIPCKKDLYLSPRNQQQLSRKNLIPRGLLSLRVDRQSTTRQAIVKTLNKWTQLSRLLCKHCGGRCYYWRLSPTHMHTRSHWSFWRNRISYWDLGRTRISHTSWWAKK